MKKTFWIVAAMFSLAGLAFAAETATPPDNPTHVAADGEFMLDARLAGMKAALKLTPDQEKGWAPFETAVRDADRGRKEAMRARLEETNKDEYASPIARLNEMSDRLAKASADVKKVADAAKPLYESLDEIQKRHFGPLLRSLRGEGRRGAMRHREGG